MTDDTVPESEGTGGQDKLARYLARPCAEEVATQTRRASQAVRGFQCPKCHCNNFHVLETRSGEDSKTRRRECRCCGYRLTTLEVPVS